MRMRNPAAADMCICVQVTANFSADPAEQAGDETVLAALGTLWAHAANLRLVLETVQDVRYIRVRMSCPATGLPLSVPNLLTFRLRADSQVSLSPAGVCALQDQQERIAGAGTGSPCTAPKARQPGHRERADLSAPMTKGWLLVESRYTVLMSPSILSLQAHPSVCSLNGQCSVVFFNLREPPARQSLSSGSLVVAWVLADNGPF